MNSFFGEIADSFYKNLEIHIRSFCLWIHNISFKYDFYKLPLVIL